MPYAIQRSTDSGATFSQDLITIEDITIRSGKIADRFFSYKDSKDNTFVLCGSSTNDQGGDGVVIKIDKNGTKYKSLFNNPNAWSSNCFYVGYDCPIGVITRDEQYIYIKLVYGSDTFNSGIFILPIFNVGSGRITLEYTGISFPETLPQRTAKLALYQDRYIWVASGSYIDIYDYNTKIQLNVTKKTIPYSPASIICTTNNICYMVDTNGQLRRFEFNGVSIVTETQLTFQIPDLINSKQMLIDKWGDLVIITNSGTTSTLLKYTTAGVKIGDTITLSGAMYNLNTDKDSNYYYSNALGTYKVPKNTAQGQAIAPLNQHVKIRDNGMTTFGNNISGYNPAVFE